MIKNMNLIDTHGHVSHFPKDQQADVLKRARVAGVQKIINVACTLEQIPVHLELAKQDENIWTSAGVHPTSLTDDVEGAIQTIHDFAKNEPKIVAIGEIGLDYYHDTFPHDLQDEWLTHQLAIATDLNLPAILHCRGGKNPGENSGAFVDLIQILEREKFSRAVVHCFSGTTEEAEAMLKMGLMISFTGVLTYSSNQALRDTAKRIPLDRIMLETDAPYLTVQSKRGQAGEPAFLVELAEVLAEVKGVSAEEVARVTTENAERFFGV